VALAGLELGAVRRVLDLGCGFGFLTARVMPRVARDAVVVGVDACEANRIPFVEAVTRAGRRAEFHAMKVEAQLPWADGSFDLVLASYSLYFFPAVLGEIARVLQPGGLFLTIAHSEGSFHSLYAVAGVEGYQTPLYALLRRFSAENGREQLARHFRDVEQFEYRNYLQFAPEQVDDLRQYVRCKIPMLLPRCEPSEEPPRELEQRLAAMLGQGHPFVIEKDDAVFRCRRPCAS
jgi:SAM-dependent methyltransferase